MKENEFNLIDEKWIPVAGNDLVSLERIFSNSGLQSLGGNPRQKIAILKLLLAIAQAAATPATVEEWAAMGPDAMAEACLSYLQKWHDKFYLYGENPFLQMPIGNAQAESPGSLQPEIAMGNNPRLTHIQCERKLTDAARALILVTEMSMCLGGKRGDKSCVLAKNYTKKSAPGGPGTGFMGILHNFVTGSSLRETIWLNLLTHDVIRQMTFLPAGLGTPPWEKMPETENCPVAENLINSLQGRLVPLARFCLWDKDLVRFTEGIRHKDRKDGVWDPTAAVKSSGAEHKILWADPEKRPWRSLTSLLAFLGHQKGYSCIQLETAIPRLQHTKIKDFSIWSGGLKVSSNSGQQFISGSDDMVESEILLNRDVIDNAAWFATFSVQMLWLEEMSKILYACVKNYYAENGEQDSGAAKKATGVFWEKAELLFADLLDACADEDRLPELKKRFVSLLEEIYDGFCGQDSPRQLAAWARCRPKISLEANRNRQTPLVN